MKKIIRLLVAVILFCPGDLRAQEINQLVQQVRAKLNQVNDYEASGRMKTNVAFLKVPISGVRIYFKKPGQLRIKNEKGISFVPKGAVSINLGTMLNSGKFTILDGGNDQVGGVPVKVVKLLPEDEESDLVLSTLYIDVSALVILKTRTTTRESGSYELELSYGKYKAYALPDKIIFSFNTRDYKMPKGMTFDFEVDSEGKKEEVKGKTKKGRAEITITNYTINKGLPDSVFSN
ncbi:MAG: hypothetical protein IPP31_01695 [Chitinophagaceae bacterium]|nr:hypothetical protein [Chitinophagaceae bacterium]